MKRKILLILASSIVCCFLSVSCGSNRQASTPPQDIIVLYENDVHCGVDGYANFAALKNEMKATHKYVTVVSNGDFVQGGSLGASSHGRNIINIMNAVGYDYVTLGNHEFDVNSLPPLMKYSCFSYICANIFPSEEAGLHIVPTKVFDVDGLKVGVIGAIPYRSMPKDVLTPIPTI